MRCACPGPRRAQISWASSCLSPPLLRLRPCCGSQWPLNFTICPKCNQSSRVRASRLLGLALARITVPVTNLIPIRRKDLALQTASGRIHLSRDWFMLVILAEAATLSDAVRGYLIGRGRQLPFSIGLPRGLWAREGFSFELGVSLGVDVRWAAAPAFSSAALASLACLCPAAGWAASGANGGAGSRRPAGFSIDCRPAPYRSTAAFSKTTRMAIQLLVLSVLSGSSRNSRGPSPALRRLRSDLCAVFALISPLGQDLYSSALVTETVDQERSDMTNFQAVHPTASPVWRLPPVLSAARAFGRRLHRYLGPVVPRLHACSDPLAPVAWHQHELLSALSRP